MIKFFKWFINLLYFFFTLALVALLVWGANGLTNTAGDNKDVPNLIKTEKDHPDTVYFSDVFAFSGTSITNAHKSREIYIDTNRDGSEKLWFVPMAWANKTITWSKNVFVAVFSPSYEMEQLDKYRNAEIIEVERLIENPVIEGETYKYTTQVIRFRDEKHPDIDRWVVIFDKEGTDIQLPNAKWANQISKYNKYNLENYNNYMKFIENKTVVKWAFAEVMIIVVLSFVIVYQNPIEFKNGENGTTEMTKSFIPKMPRPRRRQKRDRRNRHREQN